RLLRAVGLAAERQVRRRGWRRTARAGPLTGGINMTLLVWVRSSVAALAALGAAWAGAHAQQPSEEEARLARETQNRVPNTPGDGPHPALIEADPGIPGHVVYRPADLAPFGGGKLPVLAWGNGGCADDGTAHRFHL